MLTFTRAALRALTIALSALALTPAAARAGRYHVYSCRTPDGKAAPTDGWTSSTSPASATVTATDTCSSGGALTAALKDGVKHEVGSYARWTFEASMAETLHEATVWRAGDAEGGAAQNATYDFTLAGPTLSEVFSECVYVSRCTGEVGQAENPMSNFNMLPVPTKNLDASLYVTSSCGGLSGYLCPEGTNDPTGDSAVIYLYAADMILEQNAQPTVTPGSVGGELATASKINGTASLTFEATDSGSGVYQAVVEVDEKPVGSTVLDSNGGRCADVGQTSDGLPAFLYLKPCSPAVSADVPLDTTALSNGMHRIVVKVTNAAGNSTVAIDRQVEVANASAPTTSSSGSSGSGSSGSSTGSSGSSATSSSGSSTTSTLSPGGTSIAGLGALAGAGDAVVGVSAGPGAANGSPAVADAVLSAKWRSSAHATLVGRWGRAQAIVGRLTSAGGVPIVGASLEVRATPSAQGAHASAIAAPRTAADGSFSLRLSPHTSSEQIVVAYRAHADDPLPAALRTLTLRVPANLSLRVVPRVSHVGGAIAFSGALRGGPIPPGGKQLVLQARSPGTGWRTFQALSTDRRGRYSASYRFRLPGPITYSFRAVSHQEADFPFASGSSNVVRVYER